MGLLPRQDFWRLSGFWVAHQMKCRETLQQTHIYTREDHPFFPAYYKSAVGLSALAEMPLGSDTLRFGEGLSFLQAIYLGMCFTGGPWCWVQTPGLCSVVCYTSLGLNQVSHNMGCWEPIICKVLLFSSLCFFPGLLGNDSQKPAGPITMGGKIAGVQISAWAHT